MTLEAQIAEAVRVVVREELARALGECCGPEWLTTEQAAEVAGVTAKTIREWVAEGLPAKRRGRRLLISCAALDAWGQDEARSIPELVSGLTGRAG